MNKLTYWTWKFERVMELKCLVYTYIYVILYCMLWMQTLVMHLCKYTITKDYHLIITILQCNVKFFERNGYLYLRVFLHAYTMDILYCLELYTFTIYYLLYYTVTACTTNVFNSWSSVIGNSGIIE